MVGRIGRAAQIAGVGEGACDMVSDEPRWTRSDDALSAIVQSARDAIRADFAGIALLRANGRFDSLGVTNAVVWSADQLQYELGEGPCLESAPEAQAVYSADVAADPRWPHWGPAARSLGLCSVLSVELRARGRRMGTLNLYGEQPREFGPDDAAMAHLFARQASVALAAALDDDESPSRMEKPEDRT